MVVRRFAEDTLRKELQELSEQKEAAVANAESEEDVLKARTHFGNLERQTREMNDFLEESEVLSILPQGFVGP